MKKLLILLAAGLVAGFGLFGTVACDNGDGDGDADTDVDSDGDSDTDTDSDSDGDTDGECSPACDPNDCEECVDGTCESTCRAGETCDGSGHCIPDVTGAVGSPCASDDDCEVPASCWSEAIAGYPSGYCVIEYCETDGDCGTGGICVPVDWFSSYCFAECSGPGDCRSGYECYVYETYSFCLPDCTDDAQCTVTDHCEVATGPDDRGFCTCGDGRHVDEDAGECVFDDCDFLACDELHMLCDATGGCSGDCAACSGCDPSDYVASTNHCYPDGATWGGPCEIDADCPGTGMPGVDTFCDVAAGGWCLQQDGPDFASEGAACTGDDGSVGVIFSGWTGDFTACLMSCAGETRCRPGFTCEMLGTTEDIPACLPVSECGSDADCEDPGGILYCAEDGYCYVDGCDPNPCAALANSDGECSNDANSYYCGCNDGYYWVAESMTCEEFTCEDSPVTVGGTVSGDTCTGSNRYDPSAFGPSCTGYSARGQELVYSLELPANTMVSVTMTATGDFDASVWATSSCADLGGVDCVAGADDPEEMYVINRGAAAATYYIIADAYSGCGAFDLVIGSAEAAPICGNGDVEIGEDCDDGNTTDDDGCTGCEVDFGYECDEAEPTVCTAHPSIGVFAPGATIPDQSGGPLDTSEADYYLIEFTGDVLLDGTVTADTGDPDISITGEDGSSFSHVATTSVETWTDDALAAGRYIIRIRAYSAFATYTMQLSTTAP